MTSRKAFLKILAASSAGPVLARLALYGAPQVAGSPSKSEKFAERLMEDAATAWRGALSYIGDRLGIYKAMAAAGPVTVEDLARRTKLNARMLREWLNAMAAAEYVEYQPAGKRYFLPPEHAAVLADEESSPLFMGGMLELIVPMVSVANKVAEAFRTGKPITMDDFPADLIRGMERASAPAFKHQMVQQWIPAMPDVEKRLRNGGSAVDVGCGSGQASIILARAFPKARCFGYDPHGGSIAKARANAKAAGVADRVQFVVADASKLPAGKFDFLTIFNSVHHFPNPVEVMTSSRQALAPGGACFLQELALSPNVEGNINAIGRFSYSATTLWCLQDSMTSNGVGIGSDMSEPLMRELAAKAGFKQFRRLPIQHPFDAFYELKV